MTSATDADRTSGATAAAGSLVASVAAVGQVATILISWELWNSRRHPPNLDVISWLGDVDWALPLLVLAVAGIWRPRLAGPAFACVVGLAMLGDQLRIQPEILSLTVLMVAPAFGPGGWAIARWHLGTLWLWAGVHKLLSTGWSTQGAGAIAGYVDLPSMRIVVAIVLPLVEIALGLSVLWRRAWPVTSFVGAALHLGILLTLSPLFGDWNAAVWPWNLALAVAAFELFGPTAPAGRPNVRAGVVIVALVVSPAFFYVGLDGAASHNLYSGNVATAVVCDAGGERCWAVFSIQGELGVLMPPEPRLYRQWFDMECEPGAVLRARGRRTRLHDPPEVTFHECPTSPPSAEVSE